ncbi:unnamed protein product [Staurois parvus]|uniref:Uncharacterized protein n=1 Tax=Staurois parvus TaxID=386267 RepID=A0ABN9E692_9NEOB|nr:unnamed protein product [Staurois parvus]
MGPSGNRGSWDPYVLAHTPKKAYEKVLPVLKKSPVDLPEIQCASVFKASSVFAELKSQAQGGRLTIHGAPGQ